MSAREPIQPELDPALEHLMSELDDALFAGRPTGDLEQVIAERFGETSSEVVATLKALHTVRSNSLPLPSSGHTAGTEPALSSTRGTSDSPTQSRTSAGVSRTMFGRFEILERVGSGAAGTVFRARDPQLGRMVAVKIARAEALFSSEAKQRFVREAQSLAALQHPNIIPVYEFGESDGLPFIVEELCEGPNLAVWLRQQANADQMVPVRLAVQWTLLLAEAVAHAHRCGIVHRDLKPSNVLLAPVAETAARPARENFDAQRLVPRVSDFGIAKLFDSEEGVTASQAVLGTAAYMAPEQAEGRSREVGPPADVYSLGVILYELLSGRRPIEGRSDVDTLRRVLIDEPTPLARVRRDVPPDLEAICMKCLEKNSAARYPSAAELANDLSRFLEGEPVYARRLRPVARIIRRLRRRQFSSAEVLGCACLALALFAVIPMFFWRARAGAISTWQSGKAEEQRAVGATRQNYAVDIHQASLLLHGREVDIADRSAMAKEARTLLAKYIPNRGGKDLRGFEWHYLWKLTQPQESTPTFPLLRSIPAHRGTAYFASFSPDNKLVATASADGTARVWDVATRVLRFTLEGHTNEVNCATFSPDGKTLATASEDGTVRLWEASSGKLRKILWKHGREITGIAFNPANGQLACVTYDGILTVWDDTSTRPSITNQADVGQKTDHPAFSSDLKPLATAGWDATGPVTSQSQPIVTIQAHAGQKVDDLAFSSDGKRLATAGSDSMVRLWDATAKYAAVTAFQVPNAESVSFSHDRQQIAVGHAFGARIYDIRTGELLSQIRLSGQHVRSVPFTPDDSSLLTAGDKSNARVVDLPTGETWDPFGASNVFWSLALSPNGRLIATTDVDGGVSIWDCLVWWNHLRTRLPVSTDTYAVHLAASPKGDKIAIAADATTVSEGTNSGEVAIWNVAAPAPKRVLQIAPRDSRYQLQGVALAPAGDVFAYLERRPPEGFARIRVVDAETGALRFETAGERFWLDFLLFSPDGSVLVSQEQHSSAPQIRLQFRDARTGAIQRTIPIVANPAPFAMSPNEELFATAGTNRNSQIDLYRLADQQRVDSRLHGFDKLIHSLIFSKDQRFLIGRGDGGHIAVLSRDIGTVVREFTVSGVTSVVGFAMALSPDGRVLAIGSRHGIVLADFETGHALCTLPFPSEMVGVTSVAFASAGRTVAASSFTSQRHCGFYLWQADDEVSPTP